MNGCAVTPEAVILLPQTLKSRICSYEHTTNENMPCGYTRKKARYGVVKEHRCA